MFSLCIATTVKQVHIMYFIVYVSCQMHIPTNVFAEQIAAHFPYERRMRKVGQISV